MTLKRAGVSMESSMTLPVNQWTGCYDDGWGKMIVPEAYSHPAKYSHGLIRRIVEYGLSKGYWQVGSLIIDPFGGVALGGIICGYENINWLGVELELEFQREGTEYDCPGISKSEWVRWFNRFKKNIDICPQCHATAQNWYDKGSGAIPSCDPHHYIGNIAMHRAKWKALGYNVDVRLVQGDSRNLSEIVEQAGGIVTSPPWDSQQELTCEGHARQVTTNRSERSHIDAYGSTPGQIGRLKSGNVDAAILSPPYAEGLGHGGQPTRGAEHGADRNLDGMENGYSSAPQNIGNLRQGSVDGILTSPPYAESIKGDHGERETAEETTAKRNTPGGSLGQSQRSGGYGSTAGNLGNLKEGRVDSVITSPPWEKNSEGVMRADKFNDPEAFAKEQMNKGHGCSFSAKLKSMKADDERAKYGQSAGQIGNSTGGDYWHSMRDVYSECWKVLRAGGYMAIVVKGYIKQGKYIDLPGDTLKLLVHLGFEPIERIHAMLTKEWQENTLFEGEITKVKERKSFFRRNTETKAKAKKHWQTVEDQAQWLAAARRRKPNAREYRIMELAQKLAYEAAGKPGVEIETSIDFEVVLIVRKP